MGMWKSFSKSALENLCAPRRMVKSWLTRLVLQRRTHSNKFKLYCTRQKKASNFQMQLRWNLNQQMTWKLSDSTPRDSKCTILHFYRSVFSFGSTMFPASLGLLTNVHFCVHTFFARHLVWPVCKKA